MSEFDASVQCISKLELETVHELAGASEAGSRRLRASRILLMGPAQVRARSVECRKTLRTNDNQRQASAQVRAAFEPVTRDFASRRTALTSGSSCWAAPPCDPRCNAINARGLGALDGSRQRILLDG